MPASENRKMRHAHGQAGGVVEQPAVAVDVARARLAGHGDHHREGAEVHGGVDDEVGDDRGEGVPLGLGALAHHRQRHEDEAALGDRRVGEHPHDVRLAQRDEVADRHRRAPTAPRTAAATPRCRPRKPTKTSVTQGDEAGRLGGHRQERGDGRGRALVGVGRPGVEGHGRHLEGEADDDEHDAERRARRGLGSPPRLWSMPASSVVPVTPKNSDMP